MGLWLQGFAEWHEKNIKEITWFFIGFFVVCFIADVRKAAYTWAIVDLLLIALNYWSWKRDANK